MITGTFRLGGEIIRAIIDKDNLMFMNNEGVITGINGLKISKAGVIKEFPELESNEKWREIAIERLKDKIKSYKTEEEQIDYVRDELIKYGYEPMFKQTNGFRPKKWHLIGTH